MTVRTPCPHIHHLIRTRALSSWRFFSSIPMSSDQPPPYCPLYPETQPTHGFPSALSSQHVTFPGSSFQTFPQSFTGGDQSYYSGAPAEMMGPPGTFVLQPGYHGYQRVGPGPKPYGETPKHTVFVVEPQDPHGRRAQDSFLTSCLPALCCCCCLWNMLKSHIG